MAERAKHLKFVGGYTAYGMPRRYYADIPARDLDEHDIARLSDEQYARALAGDRPVYQERKRTPHDEAPAQPQSVPVVPGDHNPAEPVAAADEKPEKAKR